MYKTYDLKNVMGGAVHSTTTHSAFIATIQGVEYYYLIESTANRKHSFRESPQGEEYAPVTEFSAKDHIVMWFSPVADGVYTPIGIGAFEAPSPAELMDPEYMGPHIKRHLVNIMHSDPQNLSVDKIDHHLSIRHHRQLKMGDINTSAMDALVFNHAPQVGDYCLWQDNLSVINNPEQGRYTISYEQVQHRRTPVASTVAVKTADELYGPYFPVKAWAYAFEDEDFNPCTVNQNVFDVTQSVVGIGRNKVFESSGLIVQYSNAHEHQRQQHNREMRAARAKE